MRRAVVVLLGSVIALLAACSALAQTITVNCTHSTLPIDSKLFGHNLPWTNNAQELWNPAGATPAVRTQAKDVILNAGTGLGATIRFPGGVLGEEYRWRRGVGPYVDAQKDNVNVTKRPKSSVTGYADQYGSFGVDELQEFISQACVKDSQVVGKPMVTVNYWFWNNPDPPQGQEYDPQKGAQEAANLVEYCNGTVDDDLIQQATTEGWVPSPSPGRADSAEWWSTAMPTAPNPRASPRP